MKYGSVCSGIEAATVAWHPLGWEPQWFSEIETFPSKVLAHHYPNVPNLGDMTKIHQSQIFNATNIDLLVGGTPCQSFSVAGLRKGLDDPRGNLALHFLKLADAARPKWVVWENVPGVLSSNKGRDFGAFLGGLGQLGYGYAYRVLDAQYYGVAQRRRRVFVVGYLGDWRPAAAVLFERESLSGNPAPRREARKGTSLSSQESVGALCANSHPGSYTGQDAYTGHLIPEFIGALTAKGVESYGAPEVDGNHYIPTVIDRAAFNQGENALYDPVIEPSELMPSLVARGPHAVHQAVYDFKQITSPANRSNPKDGEISCTLAKHSDLVVIHGTQDPCVSEIAFATGRNNGQESVIALAENTIGRKPENGGNGDGFTVEGPMYTLNATGVHGVLYNSVRRLTPRECERLQGFPDNYTLILGAKDGPRYKALGNSMAVPVMHWIGTRIEMINEINK